MDILYLESLAEHLPAGREGDGAFILIVEFGIGEQEAQADEQVT